MHMNEETTDRLRIIDQMHQYSLGNPGQLEYHRLLMETALEFRHAQPPTL